LSISVKKREGIRWGDYEGGRDSVWGNVIDKLMFMELGQGVGLKHSASKQGVERRKGEEKHDMKTGTGLKKKTRTGKRGKKEKRS